MKQSDEINIIKRSIKRQIEEMQLLGLNKQQIKIEIMNLLQEGDIQ
jgi:hypothetical protein